MVRKRLACIFGSLLLLVYAFYATFFADPVRVIIFGNWSYAFGLLTGLAALSCAIVLFIYAFTNDTRAIVGIPFLFLTLIYLVEFIIVLVKFHGFIFFSAFWWIYIYYILTLVSLVFTAVCAFGGNRLRHVFFVPCALSVIAWIFFIVGAKISFKEYMMEILSAALYVVANLVVCYAIRRGTIEQAKTEAAEKEKARIAEEKREAVAEASQMYLRSMEAMAAASQAAQMQAQPAPSAEAHPNVAEEIKKYKDLLDCGAITQEEYNELKKKTLGL